MAHKSITVTLSEFRDDEPRYGRWVTILGREAAIYLAEDHLDTLRRHIDEVKSGDREPDEIELSPEDFIEPCTVNEDGVITISEGVLYDPKTYER